MSIGFIEILDIANGVLASVGVFIAIRLFVTRKKAEEHLYEKFYMQILKLEKLEEMKDLRNEIVHGKEPDTVRLKDYMKLLNECMLELEDNEKKLVKNAVSQTNKKGLYGFAAKFLAPLEASRNADKVSQNSPSSLG